MTGFGEISPKNLYLWKSFEVSFRNWQKFEPNLGNSFAIGQNFKFVNGPILKQIIYPSGHTGSWLFTFITVADVIKIVAEKI